jgi:hypothetical protein
MPACKSSAADLHLQPVHIMLSTLSAAEVPFICAVPSAAALQGSVLLFGAGLSLLLTRKIGSRPWLVLTPQCMTILGFTAELWYLLVR